MNLRTRLAAAVIAITAFPLGVFPALAQSPAGITCMDAASRARSTSECFFCGTLGGLVEIGLRYSKNAFDAGAQATQEILGIVSFFVLAGFVLKSMMLPREAQEMWPGFLKKAGWLLLATLLLTQKDVIFDFFFDLLQHTALDYGRFILAAASGAAQGVYPGAAVPTPSIALPAGYAETTQSYAQLWAEVEATVYPIVCYAGHQMSKAGFLSFAPFLSALLLMVPYLFVFGIFAAFLVQTMFYFVGVAAAAPILILGLVSEKTRGLMGSALKICLTGALTIIFASVAMGFTSAALVSLMGQYAAAVGQEQAVTIADSTFAIEGFIISPNPVQAVPAVSSFKLYWSMFLVGFVSLLLHLAAPRLAANIGGATDSAVSAAAVVGAGQLLGARAIGLTKAFVAGPGSDRLGGMVGAAGRLLGAAGGGAARGAGAIGDAAAGAGQSIQGGGLAQRMEDASRG